MTKLTRTTALNLAGWHANRCWEIHRMMEKENHKPIKTPPGSGVGVGVAIGAALGAAFDQLGLGVALGAAFGASLDGVTYAINRPKPEQD